MSKDCLKNVRYESFSQEYLVDLNATQAAIRAGYAPRSSGTKGHQLLQIVEIANRIQFLMSKRTQKTEITAERVIEELAKIGFASMRNFIRIDEDGQPQIDLSDTDDDNLDALSEVQTETVLELLGGGTTQSIRKTKIKLHDKLGALRLLAEHTGVFEKRDLRNMSTLADLLAAAQGHSLPVRKQGGDE